MQREGEALGQVQRVLALRTFDVFKELTPSELTMVAEHARPKQFRRGEALVQQGMPARALHFIVKGRVEVNSAAGRRVLTEHDTLGELAALTEDVGGETAFALEDTSTLQLDRDDMEDLFEDNFPLFGAMLRSLASAQIAVRRQLGPSAGYHRIQRETAETEPPLDLVERILVLQRTMDFAKARVEALADLAQECDEFKIQAGERLWSEGDVADRLLILVRGCVECSSRDGEQRFCMDPGSVVGGLDALAQQPRWYEAHAHEVTHVLGVQATSLFDVVEDNMGMAVDMLRVFASALEHLRKEEAQAEGRTKG